MSRNDWKFRRNDSRPKVDSRPRMTRETLDEVHENAPSSSRTHQRTPKPRNFGCNRDDEEQYYHSQRDDDCSSATATSSHSNHRNNDRDRFGNSSRDRGYGRRYISDFPNSDTNTDGTSSYRNNREKKCRITYLIADGSSRRNQNDADESRGAGIRYVGFKYLKDLSEKETEQITREILNLDSPFHLFLEKRDLQADWLFLIVNTVVKVCSLEFRDTRNAILSQICRSEFLHSVSHYLGEVCLETRVPTIENLPSFIGDLIAFYSAVIDFLPSVAVDRNIGKLIAKTKKAVDSMRADHDLNVDEDVFCRLNTLTEKFAQSKRVLEKPPKPAVAEKRNYSKDLPELPPPDNFRDLDLYPTYEDLTRRSFGYVRRNKIKGAYDDVEHYLDVQFRLLREDFIDPLRQGLNEYKETKSNPGKVRSKFKYQGLRLYPNCVFLEVQKTRKNELAFLLNFNPNRKQKINWEYSKRFMYGSLLLFSNDDFATFFFGTVSDRDIKLLTDGKILVSFPNDVQVDKNLFAKEFLMAESEVFFEPYFLVMKSLKVLNAENFPMVKYIVAGESRSTYPRYLSYDILWSVSGFQVHPLEIQRWPGPEQLGLDVYQHRALCKALTSEFCVIQGPPGTGKTFIGLKIVQTLLQNVKLNRDRIRLPLLVVCYTNHALDQFLEGILAYTNKVIRVGSQSKSEKLRDYNLRSRNQQHIRHIATAKKQLAPAFTNVRTEVKNNLNAINRITELKDSLEKPNGILKYNLFENVMSRDQKNILSHGEAVQGWLLEIEDENGPNRKMRGKKVKSFDDDDDDDDEITSSEAAGVYVPEFEEDNEDYHLVDEDEIFEMDSALLNSDNPYEITVDELGTKCSGLVERLSELDDDDIEDSDVQKDDLEALKMEVETTYSKLGILTQQLSSPILAVDEESKLKRIAARDVRHLSLPERWMLYWSWVRMLRDKVIQELQETEQKYRNSLSQYEEVKQMEDLYVVQQADVLGMTTTCAARFSTLLSALKPAIIVVEEAAEVLETHIITSLNKSCQHVILIGDHKQLKPSSAVYKLSQDYNIDVSLFERMINNGMDCPMLSVQHRMRPEISSLISPLIYADLKNDQSVYAFENVRGMANNLFFLEHDSYEQDVEDTSSRKNTFEADFLIELCKYLVLQGYDPERITMLTTYTGQMFSLREKKRNCQLIQSVKCVVVDKYQGEENDIILLSLVRSNENAKIGFLKTENRVCVALSRAKKGFYIVGNMNTLAKSSPDLWGSIAKNLREQHAIGKEMRLFCSRHEIYTNVSCPKDFDSVREGGCSKFCGELLQCGHHCQRVCHALDREHKQIRCREQCGRMCQRERHACEKLCFEDCGLCMGNMEWTLACGHKKTLACHVDERGYLCDTIVVDVAPVCKHQIQRQCHERAEDLMCPHPCEDRLDCGHRCVDKCHKKLDPDHLEYKCKKPCDKLNRMCSMEHVCQKACFEECDVCTINVDFTLKCGHKKRLPCSTNIETVECFAECESVCSNCKQKCRKMCFENCYPCVAEVQKQIAECGHQVKIACHIQPRRKDCTEQCERLLVCGHKCEAKCSEPCHSKLCTKLVRMNGKPGLCGHNFVNVPCSRKAESFDEETLRDFLRYCDAPCGARLKCGDVCAGTCGECWQGRLHKPCQRDCGIVGICGHKCKYPCQQMCPPCTEPCGFHCEHSKCPKECGVPCTPCKERCSWSCPHQRCTKKCGEICDREPCYEACPLFLNCGHPCLGYCGEPCPPKCRYCSDGITENEFGKRYYLTRYVFLVDCNHTIESDVLDKHLDIASRNASIAMMTCPQCETPITRTLRYMNHVKRAYLHLMELKPLIFGTEETLMEKRKKLQAKIRKFNSSSVANTAAAGLMEMREMCREYLRKVDVVKNKKNTISNAELNTIDFFFKAVVDINSRLGGLCRQVDVGTKSKQLRSGAVSRNIVAYVNDLLARMNEPVVQLNKQLSADLTLELRRYHKMVDYSLVLHHPSYLARVNDPTVKRLIQQLKNYIFGVERFDLVEDKVLKAFERLQEILKVSELIIDDTGLLPKAVQKFITLIHTLGFTEREMESVGIQTSNSANELSSRVSEKQIQEAYEVLKKLKDCIMHPKQGRVDETRIIQYTNQYYRLIPHHFEADEPPLLDTLEAIQEETEVLNSLMKTDKRYLLIDAYYKKLNAKLRPLAREEKRFELLKTCLDNTSGQRHEIIEIFEVERQGEDQRFTPFKQFPNRKLLWHGSGLMNFSGILAQGLRIAPQGAALSGTSFGRGIYFADLAAKSIGYCRNSGVLLLCEVALGKIQLLTGRTGSSQQLMFGYNSVKASGSNEPDPRMNQMFEDGLEIAPGPIVQSSGSSSITSYSEYVVFDEAQVKIRYLIWFK